MVEMKSETRRITTKDVFEHHLGAFAEGIDALVSDFTESSVVILPDRTVRGLGEIRVFFANFLAELQPGFWEAFKVRAQTLQGEIAYLVWEAKPFVAMATDTFLIRDGKILAQTFTPFNESSGGKA